MPRQRNPLRDTARALWEESGRSRLLKDIAAEIGVKETQVRKWKSEDKWESERSDSNGASETERSVSQEERAAAKPRRKSGAQPGNKNAVGNRGGRGNPAPKGNKYAVVTGEYETISHEDFMIAEERLSETASTDPKAMLLREYRIALIREELALKRMLRTAGNAEQGMVRANLSVESEPGSSSDEKSSKGKSTTRRTTTNHESLDERMLRHETAISNIQDKILRIADRIHKIEVDSERFELERQKVLLEAPKELKERKADEIGGFTIAYDYGGDADE